MPGSALLDAVALERMPHLARALRARPLPEDIAEVMRIAAKDEAAVAAAAERLGIPRDRLVRLARLYLREVVLFPGADTARVLGLSPAAPPTAARCHRRWLILWLHPDRASAPWEAALFHRVQTAWAGYATAPTAADLPASRPPPAEPVPRMRWVRVPLEGRTPRPPRRAQAIAAGTLVAVLLVPLNDHGPDAPGPTMGASPVEASGSAASSVVRPSVPAPPPARRMTLPQDTGADEPGAHASKAPE